MTDATFEGDAHVMRLPSGRRWIWGYAGSWVDGAGATKRGTIVSGPSFASKGEAVEDLREELGNASLAVRCTCVDCERKSLERRLRRRGLAVALAPS